MRRPKNLVWYAFVVALFAALCGFLVLGPAWLTRLAPQFVLFAGAMLLAWSNGHRRKWITAAVWAAAGVLWMLYFYSATKWLQSLGSDSFAEIEGASFRDTAFWLSTMSQVLWPEFLWPMILGFVVAAIVIIALLELAFRMAGQPRHFAHRFMLLLAVGWIVAALSSTFGRTVNAYADNSALSAQVLANFETPATLGVAAKRRLDVVVYIGESTSMFHWGLYGYPRNTTPMLDKMQAGDSGLLVFHNVLSTHTHTTQSLLEAFSIPAGHGPEVAPITERKRISIADVTSAAGIKTLLFSNQGRTGTFNMVAPAIFGRIERHFSTDTALAANVDELLDKPADDQYFAGKFTSVVGQGGSGRNLVFLHSIAGHGTYNDHMELKYLAPVDDDFANLKVSAAAGNALGTLTGVDRYDSAMRYIDLSVASQIEETARVNTPAVAIYFSDHGEAPFTGRAHDSSRFVHEMARVPFLMYFNAAARQAYPELFDKYRALAEARRIGSLSQFAATLTDLFDVEIKPGPVADWRAKSSIIGEDLPLPPIVARRVGERLLKIDLNVAQRKAGASSGDLATRLFVAAHRTRGPQFCYDRANSLASARRGGLVTGCIAFEVEAGAGSRLRLKADPPGENTLPAIIGQAKRNGDAVWLDATGQPNQDACASITRLSNEAELPAKTLVAELTIPQNGEWGGLRQCLSGLAKNGVDVIVRVPEKPASRCARALDKGKTYGSVPACQRLERQISRVSSDGSISGLSFEPQAQAAIEASTAAKTLTWNLRHLGVERLHRLDAKRYARIVFQTDDLNSR